MNIFLVGMMGSGKSYWSKALAQHFNLEVFDLDTVIENLTNKTIADIFEEEGEVAFRQIETQALKAFENKSNFVLATGGGTPCFNNNMQYMNTQGTTIWLNESIDILAKRLTNEKSHRPLIKNLTDNELANFLTEKLLERKAFYSQASLQLNSKQLQNGEWIKGIGC